MKDFGIETRKVLKKNRTWFADYVMINENSVVIHIIDYMATTSNGYLSEMSFGSWFELRADTSSVVLIAV